MRSRIQKTSKIPIGYVATYGQIAGLTSNSRAARAVGMCMKTNLFAPRVPCHRVVASDGMLTGFSAPGGIARKKKMLMDEGVIFHNEKVDISICLWNAL